MLIAAGQVARMDNFVAKFESTGREIISTGEFAQRYEAGPRAMMSEVIKRAREVDIGFS